MSTENMSIDPNEVIQDLISQVSRLTADNTLLRVALRQAQGASEPVPTITDSKVDLPDQTK